MICGAGARTLVKKLLRGLGRGHPSEVDAYTSELIALARSSDERCDGVCAFLEKWLPAWRG